jgi:hypothetical protein
MPWSPLMIQVTAMIYKWNISPRIASEILCWLYKATVCRFSVRIMKETRQWYGLWSDPPSSHIGWPSQMTGNDSAMMHNDKEDRGWARQWAKCSPEGIWGEPVLKKWLAHHMRISEYYVLG